MKSQKADKWRKTEGTPDPGTQEGFEAGNQGQSVPAAGDLSELKFFS